MAPVNTKHFRGMNRCASGIKVRQPKLRYVVSCKPVCGTEMSFSLRSSQQYTTYTSYSLRIVTLVGVHVRIIPFKRVPVERTFVCSGLLTFPNDRVQYCSTLLDAEQTYMGIAHSAQSTVRIFDPASIKFSTSYFVKVGKSRHTKTCLLDTYRSLHVVIESNVHALRCLADNHHAFVRVRLAFFPGGSGDSGQPAR